MNSVPKSDEIRRILEAAADVIFSDGVSTSFLDHWADTTTELLNLRSANMEQPVGAVR